MVLVLTPELRTETFRAFKSILDWLSERNEKPYFDFDLDYLAGCSQKDFDRLTYHLTRSMVLRRALSALLIIPDLPGLARWQEKLPEPDEDAEDRLLRACQVASSQSGRSATDIAFLQFVSFLCQGRLRIPPGMVTIEQINQYVVDPDSSEIEGMVRASRNAGMTAADDRKSEWVRRFYDWGRTNTSCFGFTIEEDNEDYGKLDNLQVLLNSVSDAASVALISDFQQYGQNDLRETIAGLALYSCELSYSTVNGSQATLTSGMVLMRSLAEVLILSEYLASDQGKEVVRRYRQYGAGRAKLLVNKVEEQGEAASAFNFLEFSSVANEREDEMFTDMPLTSFYKPNIRDIASHIGMKDIYDKYYDICSTYTHGEWSAVGSTSVQMCMNPLHLGHYIPSKRVLPSDTASDVSWLLTRIGNVLERVVQSARPAL